MRFLDITSILFFLVLCSCDNQKKIIVSNAEETATVITNDSKMLELGFIKAIIKDFTVEEGCGFLIVLEDSEQVLQTLKPLEESFQKEGLKVWIKYRPIRPIAPFCTKGIPINLEEIKKM